MKRFGKSVRLTYTTSQLAFKSIFTQLAILALFVAILALSVYPLYERAVELISQTQITTKVTDLYLSITAAEFNDAVVTALLTDIIEEVRLFIESTEWLFNSLIWGYVAILLVAVFFRFVQSLVDVPIGATLHDFMGTNNSRGYIWYFFKKLGYAAKFSICQLSLTLFLDLFVICGSLGLYIVMLSPLGATGIVIAFLFLLLAYSARLTITAFWLPEYTSNGYKAVDALKTSIGKVVRWFPRVFLKTSVMVIFIGAFTVLFNYLSSLVNEFGWAVVLVGMFASYWCYYMIKCINFVEFYEQTDKPYFTRRIKLDENTDYQTIVIE